MSATAEKLLENLTRLPFVERERLVSCLCDDESKIDIGPEWAEEIRSRVEDFENGKAETVSSEEFFASLGLNRTAIQAEGPDEPLSAEAEKILGELLALSELERNEIIDRMYEAEDESDYDPEYVEELQRRIDDHESGRTKGIPWAEARKIIFAEGEDDAAS